MAMEYLKLTPEELLGPLNGIEAKHAPKQLFAAGNLDIVRGRSRVAIVGSRKASPEGIKRARRMAQLLCKHGITVVSGLAEGIDAAAHRAAIEIGGQTVGVIGTPLDKEYPRQNAELQRRMMEEQLVLSQFAIGSAVNQGNFPARNRTMALIADASVIIEAGETSGTIHQGWEALRLGRRLFIAQSLAENTSLVWPRKMMDYGARVLSDETLDEFFDFLPDRSHVESSSVLSF